MTYTAVAPTINFGSLVYSALYRYDAHYNAVPDLADGPCLPQADPKVIRCRIVDTTFHDGQPLTAEDVAYSIRLAGALGELGGLDVHLKEARVIDGRTVDFVLSKVDPTFLTTLLPTSQILEKSEVEAAYADLVARSKGFTAEGVQALIDAANEGLESDPRDCTSSRVDVDALLTRLGVSIYKSDYRLANGTLDPCGYLSVAADRLWMFKDFLTHEGLPAVFAGAVAFGAPFRPLVGTGPYRYVSQDADGVHFTAFAGYHGGPAVTSRIDFVPARGDGSDLLARTVDILQFANLGASYETRAAAEGIQFATPAGLEIYGLVFNVRSGRLFADVALRRALQLCIDLPRDVDTATRGLGTPLYGGVIPGSWAADPDLPEIARDVSAGRRMIEAAGWEVGPDGVYAKGQARLAARIVVPGEDGQRVSMADLIAVQAADCGMALKASPTNDMATVLATSPHYIPGTTTPFDVLIVHWFTNGPDPDMSLSGFTSSQITDSDYESNLGGFSDPEYDRLIAAAEGTYDQAERTRIYRQAQERMASEQPVMWLWSPTNHDALGSAVAAAEGPLDLAAPNWGWQPEKLVLAAGR